MAKITTGKVRLSYPHLAEPRQSTDGGDAKYSATLLIPKTDKETITKIKNAIADAAAEYREKNGSSSLPPKPSTTLHDGDQPKDNGEEYGPECKGCYVITCSSKQMPLYIDRNKEEIMDVANELYAGCYVRASLNFRGYNFNGKKGITAYLNAIMKVAEGEPFGGARTTAADFDDGYDYGDDDDFLD